MFECKMQEITDKNTGVTLTFGEHAPPRNGENGTRWIRVAVPQFVSHPTRGKDGGLVEPPPKISTIFFTGDGQVLRIATHGEGQPLIEPDKVDAEAGKSREAGDRELGNEWTKKPAHLHDPKEHHDTGPHPEMVDHGNVTGAGGKSMHSGPQDRNLDDEPRHPYGSADRSLDPSDPRKPLAARGGGLDWMAGRPVEASVNRPGSGPAVVPLPPDALPHTDPSRPGSLPSSDPNRPAAVDPHRNL